ncbi:MAG: hypothetical protein NTW59_03585, partial [Candidatus Diapherotrites archaeon]|nr:hypothetical protein [Candidatus Diapherotrites archaeon]
GSSYYCSTKIKIDSLFRKQTALSGATSVSIPNVFTFQRVFSAQMNFFSGFGIKSFPPAFKPRLGKVDLVNQWIYEAPWKPIGFRGALKTSWFLRHREAVLPNVGKHGFPTSQTCGSLKNPWFFDASEIQWISNVARNHAAATGEYKRSGKS